MHILKNSLMSLYIMDDGDFWTFLPSQDQGKGGVEYKEEEEGKPGKLVVIFKDSHLWDRLQSMGKSFQLKLTRT